MNRNFTVDVDIFYIKPEWIVCLSFDFSENFIDCRVIYCNGDSGFLWISCSWDRNIPTEVAEIDIFMIFKALFLHISGYNFPISWYFLYIVSDLKLVIRNLNLFSGSESVAAFSGSVFLLYYFIGKWLFKIKHKYEFN